MVFVDDLAYSLFVVSFAGLLLLYTSGSIYLDYRKKQRNITEHLKSAAIPLALIGLYLLLMGLWGQFAWPLPGSYNILFYDPMISFAILLIAFSLSVKFNLRFEYVGFLSLIAGILVTIYGFLGYKIGLTQSPLALLAMYTFYGLAGIFSYPVSLLIDRPFDRNMWARWHLLVIIFCVLLLAASAVSGVVGLAAISQHLVSAP